MVESRIKNILKRSGMLVKFDQERIINAIHKAQLSLGLEDRSLAQRLSDVVVEKMNHAYTSDSPPTVEEIQDMVVGALDEEGLHNVATAYREYRAEHARIREEKDEQIVVNDTVPYKILWQVFAWNVEHECDNVERLNQQVGDGRINKLISDAELKYHYDVDRIVEKILKRRDQLRIIIIAGPSSSGKTTTTIKINERLSGHGLEVVALNLDNYFFELDTHPQDEFGDYDFERPEALDLTLINEHLGDLMRGKTVQTPIYNFKSGKREKETAPF
ncbi:MAG: ATP cone domain-containing protein, partial [bacterium]